MESDPPPGISPSQVPASASSAASPSAAASVSTTPTLSATPSSLPTSTSTASAPSAPGVRSARSSSSSLGGGPSSGADAIKHYETLSALHRQLAELESALARERSERASDADRMAEMLVRMAERERSSAIAEKRADEACARVAALEGELATAQMVAAALDEQLVATEQILASLEGRTLSDGDVADVDRDWRNEPTSRPDLGELADASPHDDDPTRQLGLAAALARAESAERDRDVLRNEVTVLRASLEEMRARTDAMGEALEGLRKAMRRATSPPPPDS